MERDDNIGENIKKYRTKQGLSQEDFAKKYGVKYTTLTKIESRVIKKPLVLVMAKIAKALGVSIDELLKKQIYE
jgi:transcriptional regulator with XRE-family HTH domain